MNQDRSGDEHDKARRRDLSEQAKVLGVGPLPTPSNQHDAWAKDGKEHLHSPADIAAELAELK